MEQVLEPVKQATELVGSQGLPVVVSSIVVLALAVAVYLAYTYFSRKLSSDYVSKNDLVPWLKEHRPDLLKPALEDLPDLRNHKFFAEATRQMRMAEAATSQAERDLAIWTMRAYRGVFSELVESVYEDKIGFDLAIGDSAKFRARLNAAMTEANQAIKYRLVQEFGFPTMTYAKWQQDRELSDELMTNMLDLAAEKGTPYDRLATALDSQYARMLMLRRAVSSFIAKNEVFDYAPPGEASHSTMQSIQPLKGSYPAAVFERRKK